MGALGRHSSAQRNLGNAHKILLHQSFDPGQGCTHKSMFSRLLHNSVAFLFPFNAHSEPVSNSQANQQIQTELEQAAEQGMVSTRSQDNPSAGGVSQPSQVLYPQVVVLERKRKIENGGEESSAQAVTKRRHMSAKSNGDVAIASSIHKPGRLHGRVSTQDAHGDASLAMDQNESDQEPSAQGSHPDSLQKPIITTEQIIENRGKSVVEVAVSKPSDARFLNNEVSEADDQVNTSFGRAVRSKKGKISKERTKDSDEIAGVDDKYADVSSPEKKPETLSATAAKSTHKRFGSEDIEVLGTAPLINIEEGEGSQEDVSDEEGESGNEAPETVTASVSFDKARTSALNAAKFVAR